MKRHPSWSDLNRLVDGELDADSRGPAKEHVAACPKCARSVSFLRDLRKAGGDMRHPSPPKDLLNDILKDRSEGVRVILPAVPATPGPRRRTLPAAAALAVMVSLAGLAALTLAPEAGAGASELQVYPPKPVPGEQVRITYRPGVELAGETALKLRLRLRGPDAEPPRQTLGTYQELVLRPDADGLYVGSLQLPSDFAYAVMAVENLAGDRLDDRAGRFWSVSAHGADEAPMLEALRQKFLVLQERSWPEARTTLTDMTLLYPERAEGWSLQLTYEVTDQLPSAATTSPVDHRQNFRRFQERFADEVLSTDEVVAMARYALALEEMEAFERWVARLESVAPTHRLVLSSRTAGHRAHVDADVYLEQMWMTEADRSVQVCREGFSLADDAGDDEVARRWASRCLPLEDDPWVVRDMALALVASPETRPQGIAAMHALLVGLDETPDVERPLNKTPSEVRLESRRLRAVLSIALGQQLLESGEPAEAIVELDAADRLGLWLPDLYRARLEARLRLGDEAGALSDLCRLSADPVYSRESVDSIRLVLPPVTHAELSEGRRRAEQEMERRLTARHERRGLPATQLLTSTGQARSLESLLMGRLTVLVFWDRRVFHSPEDIANVIQAGHLLAGHGQLLWVTPEPDSEALQSFRREFGLVLPAYQDPGAELATGLGEWGVRGFFVIDEAGVIRARTNSLMEAVRHIEVLRMGSRVTA